jgi:hypothetical protein
VLSSPLNNEIRERDQFDDLDLLVLLDRSCSPRICWHQATIRLWASNKRWMCGRRWRAKETAARRALRRQIVVDAEQLHRNVLAIALANKLARIAWSVLARGRAFEASKLQAAGLSRAEHLLSSVSFLFDLKAVSSSRSELRSRRAPKSGEGCSTSRRAPPLPGRTLTAASTMAPLGAVGMTIRGGSPPSGAVQIAPQPCIR